MEPHKPKKAPRTGPCTHATSLDPMFHAANWIARVFARPIKFIQQRDTREGSSNAAFAPPPAEARTGPITDEKYDIVFYLGCAN